MTFGVKHLADFPERRETFTILLSSLRKRYTCPALVSIDGSYLYSDAFMDYYNVKETKRRNTNLSRGRNDIIMEALSAYVVIMDDDLRFTKRTDLSVMLGMMQSQRYAVVTGCYEEQSAISCYNYNIIRTTE